jgi:hypothetical protein
MKSVYIIAVSFLVGFAGVFVYDSFKKDQFFVQLEFRTGNTVNLSEGYDSYDACVSSAEFVMHDAAGKLSGSVIKCSSNKSTYNL